MDHAAERTPARRQRCHAGAWPGCATHMWQLLAVGTAGSRGSSDPGSTFTRHGASGMRLILGREGPAGLCAVHVGPVGGGKVGALRTILLCSDPEVGLNSEISRRVIYVEADRKRPQEGASGGVGFGASTLTVLDRTQSAGFRAGGRKADV